ncbi:MAG: hypothetical protein AAGF60_08215 [Pseudomonadota bacterium]
MADIYAAPFTRRHPAPLDGTPADAQGWAYDLQTALQRARPGDRVILLPGRYTRPATMTRSGTPDQPITICAAQPGTARLSGGRSPHRAGLGGMKPLDGDFAFLKFFDVAHINVEGLHFDSCWPSCLYARAVQYLTIRDCHAQEGRFFLYLWQRRDAHTHHVTVEDCSWVQDPAFDMWTGRVRWADVKGQSGTDATWLNGAFVGGFDVAGRLIVRRCDVRHAFNAVRLDMRACHIADGPILRRNVDVAIYDNRFSFIRDNVVEPECGAQNWRVFDNLIFCAHAAFSQDKVASRDMFYIGNRVLNVARAGPVRADGSDGQQPQGGRIFKWFKAGTGTPAARRGFWSLFTLAQTRTAYVKKGVTRDWHDAYTLLGLYPKEYPQAATTPRHPFDRMNWQGVRVTGLVTDDAVHFGAYSGQAEVTAQQVARVFAPPLDVSGQPLDAAHLDLSAPLGGWDGGLVPTGEAAGLRSAPLTLQTLEGPLSIPEVPLGAVDVADLGLGHWREAWPNGPPGGVSV